MIQGGRATTVTMRQKGLCPDSPQSNRSNGARPKDQKGAKDQSGSNNRKSPESSEAYGTGSTTGSEATTEESHPQQVQPLIQLFFCLKLQLIKKDNVVFVPSGNLLLSVSDPLMAFQADLASFEGPQFCLVCCFRSFHRKPPKVQGNHRKQLTNASIACFLKKAHHL